MKKHLFLAFILGTSFSVRGLDLEEKEQDIRDLNKRIEQQEWEQERFDWHQDKEAVENKTQARKRQERRVQDKRLEQKRTENRIQDRKREDSRR